jgi:Ca-activated chloride channel homolog
MSLTLTADRRLIRDAGKSARYLVANIEAPLRSGERRRLPLNFALVIDRSGSMTGAKILHARDAAIYALGQLQQRDRIAVVAYADTVEVVMPSAPATRAAVADASRRIGELDTNGTTDLAGGWFQGCREIADQLDDEQIARCLLLTDGLANRGTTDRDVLAAHAAELRARGIVTSTFGIGTDFDEVLLARLAEAGGGTFRLIRDAEEIPALIREELQEGLDVVAAQAELEVIAPPGVHVRSLNDFPTHKAGSATIIQLGDLVSGQTLAPVLRLEFPAGGRGERLDVSVRLRNRDDTLVSSATVATFEFADPPANARQPRAATVDRAAAALYAARARRQALALNRDGDFAGAERVVAACAERIRGYAGGDPELDAIAAALERERQRLGRDMDIMTRKRDYSLTVSDVKMRSSSGASLRRSAKRSVLVVPCAADAAQAAAAAVRTLHDAEVGSLGELRVASNWSALKASVASRGALNPVDENRLVDTAQSRWPGEGMRLVLTEAQLPDNAFSHWHAVGRTAVASLVMARELAEADLAAYIAYEILLNGLNNASPYYDLLRIAHEDTRGCLFDFCADKHAMAIKLQTMHLCTACAGELERLGLDHDELARATAAIRALAQPLPAAAEG